MTRIVYIVCGSPGAGKTSYGKELAKLKQATFLDIDTATERLVKLSLELLGKDVNDRDSNYFKTHFRNPIYEQLFDIAQENLAWNNVIITGPFTREIKDPSWTDKLSARLGVPVEVHYVFCPPSIREVRIRQRNNPRDLAKLASWEDYLGYYESEPLPACGHILVDNTLDKEIKNSATALIS
jgi:predicted kinase